MTHLDPTELAESLGEFARAAASSSSPVIRFATFSGNDADVRYADDAVYVRYTYDHNDETYEDWGRLFAPNNAWEVPTTITEVLVVCPAEIRTPGAAWVMFGCFRPIAATRKFGQKQATKVSDDSVQHVGRAGGWLWRSATGLTFGTNLANGAFQVRMGTTGSNITFDPAHNTIILSISKADAGEQTPRAEIRLTEDGVHITSGDGSLVPVASTRLDITTSGKMLANGTTVSLAFQNGALGGLATPVSPVLWGLTGLAGVPSTSWFVSP